MKQCASYDVVIVGAGAAGLMCAIEAGKRGRSVLVIEKGAKPGRKIRISGGGRCNFTNLYIEPTAYISRNPHFAKSALARYTQWDFIALVDAHGIRWHEKTLGQLFCDGSATEVVAMLLKECADAGVEIRMATTIEKVDHDEMFLIQTSRGLLQAKSLVIASGGLSIPRMGSTDFGYRIASQFGHQLVDPRPSLVPLTIAERTFRKYFDGLSGVSLPVAISIGDIDFREQMLITHKGLSGPAILQVSSYWEPGVPIEINLLPDIDVANWLVERKRHQPASSLKSVLNEQMPKRLVERLVGNLLPDTVLQHLADEEVSELANKLTGWRIFPVDTEGYRIAEVTGGGVDTTGLSSRTMESQCCSGLYFIGEVVDVTGWLGGYNFQWAWSSGWCAGQFA